MMKALITNCLGSKSECVSEREESCPSVVEMALFNIEKESLRYKVAKN